MTMATLQFGGTQSIAQGQDVCAILTGAAVVSSDGTYLGKLGSAYSSDSIYNEYGTYGSKYSSNSIWNDYGTYGSAYSGKSARSEYASDPPMISKGGQLLGYLTTNQYKNGAINPLVLGVTCFGYKPSR